MKANVNNNKLNVYKKVLQEVCEKCDGTKGLSTEKIEEICSNGKLSVEEVTYLFMNDLKLKLVVFVRILQPSF